MRIFIVFYFIDLWPMNLPCWSIERSLVWQHWDLDVKCFPKTVFPNTLVSKPCRPLFIMFCEHSWHPKRCAPSNELLESCFPNPALQFIHWICVFPLLQSSLNPAVLFFCHSLRFSLPWHFHDTLVVSVVLMLPFWPPLALCCFDISIAALWE